MSAAHRLGDDGVAQGRANLWSAWVTLLAASGTLVCCALPALMVMLGAGAALAGLVAAVPQLVWLSEHKGWVFGIAGALLAAAGAWQWSMRHAPCPADARLAAACTRTRRLARGIWWASAGLFVLGAGVAFVLPAL